MKEVVRFILNTITIFISMVAVLIIVFYLFGVVPTIISSGSMSPSIPTGSLCFINKNYPFEKIKEDDVIAYYQLDQRVIHRVIRVNKNDLRTKGDNNDFTDRLRATKENYYGKYVFSIPYVGYYITALQTVAGKVIFIIALIIIFVADYNINKKRIVK